MRRRRAIHQLVLTLWIWTESDLMQEGKPGTSVHKNTIRMEVGSLG
jgi:hypothetical protein